MAKKRTKAQIEKDLAKLRAELAPIEETERSARLRSLVGKCFIYRRNSYSLPTKPSDYWDVYYLVTGHDGYWPIGLELQYTALHEVIIRPQQQNVSIGRGINSGYEECSRAEFDRHLSLITEKVNKLSDPAPL